MTYLHYLWQRIRCLFGRHALVESIQWAPDHTCLIVECEVCQTIIYHQHFGQEGRKATPRNPAQPRVH